jgi:co-chaperonin GroES (HSP10)
MSTIRKARKTFAPIGDLVALEVHQVSQTSGGVVLPDGVEDPLATPTAKVISIGPDCQWVKEGDTVLVFGDTVGRNVYHDGSKVVMVKEERIAGIVL